MDRYPLDEQVRDRAIDQEMASAAREMRREAREMEDAIRGLLFWIAQGDFSRMPVPAIEAMHKAIAAAKKMTT